MERKNLLIILVAIVLIIAIAIFSVNKKEDTNSKQENVNQINYSDTTIVPIVDEENPTDSKYNVKTEDGQNVISYEVVDVDEENTIYTIKDANGKEIGNTTNQDEIRLYVENPEYSEYGPSIK